MQPVPALPQLDGVAFRTFRDESDYPHFARIITAAAVGEASDRVETVEGLSSAYDHLDRCDPKRDLLVAEVDGRPVGYSRLWWDQEADGPRIYRQVCFLDPVFGGRGIGSALVAWNEQRLCEIAAEHDVPEKKLEAFANDRNAAAAALIRGAGYEPVTYEGAGHGFMRAGEAPDANEPNKKAREEAWKRLKDLLKKI